MQLLKQMHSKSSSTFVLTTVITLGIFASRCASVVTTTGSPCGSASETRITCTPLIQYPGWLTRNTGRYTFLIGEFVINIDPKFTGTPGWESPVPQPEFSSCRFDGNMTVYCAKHDGSCRIEYEIIHVNAFVCTTNDAVQRTCGSESLSVPPPNGTTCSVPSCAVGPDCRVTAAEYQQPGCCSEQTGCAAAPNPAATGVISSAFCDTNSDPFSGSSSGWTAGGSVGACRSLEYKCADASCVRRHVGDACSGVCTEQACRGYPEIIASALRSVASGSRADLEAEIEAFGGCSDSCLECALGELNYVVYDVSVSGAACGDIGGSAYSCASNCAPGSDDGNVSLGYCRSRCEWLGDACALDAARNRSACESACATESTSRQSECDVLSYACTNCVASAPWSECTSECSQSATCNSSLATFRRLCTLACGSGHNASSAACKLGADACLGSCDLGSLGRSDSCAPRDWSYGGLALLDSACGAARLGCGTSVDWSAWNSSCSDSCGYGRLRASINSACASVGRTCAGPSGQSAQDCLAQCTDSETALSAVTQKGATEFRRLCESACRGVESCAATCGGSVGECDAQIAGAPAVQQSRSAQRSQAVSRCGHVNNHGCGPACEWWCKIGCVGSGDRGRSARCRRKCELDCKCNGNPGDGGGSSEGSDQALLGSESDSAHGDRRCSCQEAASVCHGRVNGSAAAQVDTLRGWCTSACSVGGAALRDVNRVTASRVCSTVAQLARSACASACGQSDAACAGACDRDVGVIESACGTIASTGSRAACELQCSMECNPRYTACSNACSAGGNYVSATNSANSSQRCAAIKAACHTECDVGSRVMVSDACHAMCNSEYVCLLYKLWDQYEMCDDAHLYIDPNLNSMLHICAETGRDLGSVPQTCAEGSDMHGVCWLLYGSVYEIVSPELRVSTCNTLVEMLITGGYLCDIVARSRCNMAEMACESACDAGPRESSGVCRAICAVSSGMCRSNASVATRTIDTAECAAMCAEYVGDPESRQCDQCEGISTDIWDAYRQHGSEVSRGMATAYLEKIGKNVAGTGARDYFGCRFSGIVSPRTGNATLGGCIAAEPCSISGVAPPDGTMCAAPVPACDAPPESCTSGSCTVENRARVFAVNVSGANSTGLPNSIVVRASGVSGSMSKTGGLFYGSVALVLRNVTQVYEFESSPGTIAVDGVEVGWSSVAVRVECSAAVGSGGFDANLQETASFHAEFRSGCVCWIHSSSNSNNGNGNNRTVIGGSVRIFGYSTRPMSMAANVTRVEVIEACSDVDADAENQCRSENACEFGDLKCEPVTASHGSSGACRCVVGTGCVCGDHGECTSASDCRDHDRCTVDTCHLGECKHVAIPGCTDREHRNHSHWHSDPCTWKNCDDGDACTADSCVSGACTHVPNAVDPTVAGLAAEYGKCANVACDRRTGTWTVARMPVDDGNSCTDDWCDVSTGDIHHDRVECQSDPALGRCMEARCSNDAGGCVDVQVVCDDGDRCTVDACDPAVGCVHVPVDCGCNSTTGRLASDPCTSCGCTRGGGCFAVPVECASANPCVESRCVGGSCASSKAECGCIDGHGKQATGARDACVKCGCSADGGGCYSEPVDCDDGLADTVDTCDPDHGCQHRSVVCPVPPGGPCFEYHLDRVSGACSTVAIEKDCDDGNACTVDSCRISDGRCIHEARNCSLVIGGGGCTIAHCDPGTGYCIGEPLDCDDGNACTDDWCESMRCGHSQVVCPQSPGDYDACVMHYCSDDSGGCVSRRKSCDDDDACTVDVCDGANGECKHFAKELNCSDPPGDAFVGSCDRRTGGCRYDAIGLDDGDACTDDVLVFDAALGRRVAAHLPKRCKWMDDPCYREIPCNRLLGCLDIERSCDDGSPCTEDRCVAGSCQHVARNCSDGDPCTEDWCSDSRHWAAGVEDGACVHARRNCDDGSSSTIDACIRASDVPATPGVGGLFSGEQWRVDGWGNSSSSEGAFVCYHELTPCDDGDPCTRDFRDADRLGICTHVPVACGDANDQCVVGRCVPNEGGAAGYRCDYTRTECPVSDDGCSASECDPGTGKCGPLIPKNCDDGSKCTADSCTAGGTCANVPIDCDDGDACTRDWCVPSTGQCAHAGANCDDGNACTRDSCDPTDGECRHEESVECETSDPCVPVACDRVTGRCVSHEISCDDGNWCTADWCEAGRCKHNATQCPHASCRVEWCDPGTGACRSADRDCDDHNPRTDDWCDRESDECVHSKRECHGSDPCVVYSLDSDTGRCTETRKDCDDSDPCTLDECRASDGECIHAPVECADEDENACTIERCVSATGRCEVIERRTCDDGDACTYDSCDVRTGECVHRVETCGAYGVGGDEGGAGVGWQKCEDRFCDSRDGRCYSKRFTCDDGDACTEDSCHDGTGCVHRSRRCAPRRVEGVPEGCVVATCDPGTGVCRQDRKQCQSPDPRMVCACVSGGRCECTRISCKATSDLCLIDTDGTCRDSPRDCRDDDPCTVDSCSDGECIHEPKCDDGNACTVDACSSSNGACTTAPVNCTGGDKCKLYACDPVSGCYVAGNVTGPCGDCETCHCSPETGEWVRNQVQTDDGDLCTIDFCEAGIIYHIQRDCSDGDPCTRDSCRSGECVHTAAWRDYLRTDPHPTPLSDACHHYACLPCESQTASEEHPQTEGVSRVVVQPGAQTRGVWVNVTAGRKAGAVSRAPVYYAPKFAVKRSRVPPSAQTQHGRSESNATLDGWVAITECRFGETSREGSAQLMYKLYTAKTVYTEPDECTTSTCEMRTGRRVRKRLPDGTRCHSEVAEYAFACMSGVCTKGGVRPVGSAERSTPDHGGAAVVVYATVSAIALVTAIVVIIFAISRGYFAV